MALPETIRVKLSSEDGGGDLHHAGGGAGTAVRELVEHMLGVAGKDEARIREMLLRGTLVSGASRFRWVGWDAEPESLRALLATFPDAEPERPFDAGAASGRCCAAAAIPSICRAKR